MRYPKRNFSTPLMCKHYTTFTKTCTWQIKTKETMAKRLLLLNYVSKVLFFKIIFKRDDREYNLVWESLCLSICRFCCEFDQITEPAGIYYGEQSHADIWVHRIPKVILRKQLLQLLVIEGPHISCPGSPKLGPRPVRALVWKAGSGTILRTQP